MSKRTAEELGSNPGRSTYQKTAEGSVPAPTVNHGVENDLPNDVEMGEFEDPDGDDFESDEEIIQINSENDDDDEDGAENIDNPDPRNIIKEDFEQDLKAESEDSKNQSTIY